VLVRNFQELDDLFELQVGQKVIRLGSEGLVGLKGEPVEAPS
jgi:DtxR family Mn-dependent transcriptional regulator